MTNDILVVILAGGEGKRFLPFVTDKTLFPFMGKPLLQHTLELVENAGLKQVLIACNQTNQQWLDSYSSSMSIRTVLQDQPLGMADAMLALADHIGNQPIIVMNAVDLVEQSLFEALLNKSTNAYALVTGMRVSEYFPGGYLEVESDRVTSIIEKPPRGSEPSDLVNLVFHYLSQPHEFISLLSKTQSSEDDVYEKALYTLMQEKEVGFVSYSGKWSKLKYPHFVLDVSKQLLEQISTNQIHSTAQVHPTAIVEGSVIIDEGVKVYEYAVIKGPAYIGKNSIIGNHSLVLQSEIESNCVIGAGSEVSRSYIGPETWLHHNFVGDSVLEGKVNPSYGTVFSNLRLDKQSIQVKLPSGEVDTGKTKLGSLVAEGMFSGVNCSFMPGTVVTPNARILPNQVVKGLVS